MEHDPGSPGPSGIKAELNSAAGRSGKTDLEQVLYGNDADDGMIPPDLDLSMSEEVHQSFTSQNEVQIKTQSPVKGPFFIGDFAYEDIDLSEASGSTYQQPTSCGN